MIPMPANTRVWLAAGVTETGFDIWRSAEALVQQHGSADAARQWALSRADELDQAGSVAMKRIAAVIGEMERPKGGLRIETDRR